MQLKEAIELIETERLSKQDPEIWVDLGCGSGLFTRALAGHLAPGSMIYAVDKSPQNITLDEKRGIKIRFIQADFEQDKLPVPKLDGIMMANALHFVPDKPLFVEKLKGFLKADGQLIIVEYDTTRSNPWVPYPVDFNGLRQLFADAGFDKITKMGERRSLFGHKNMYAALIST